MIGWQSCRHNRGDRSEYLFTIGCGSCWNYAVQTTPGLRLLEVQLGREKCVLDDHYKIRIKYIHRFPGQYGC